MSKIDGVKKLLLEKVRNDGWEDSDLRELELSINTEIAFEPHFIKDPEYKVRTLKANEEWKRFEKKYLDDVRINEIPASYTMEVITQEVKAFNEKFDPRKIGTHVKGDRTAIRTYFEFLGEVFDKNNELIPFEIGRVDYLGKGTKIKLEFDRE